MNVEELRSKHPKFIYENFRVVRDNTTVAITCSFLLAPNIQFHPTVTIPLPPASRQVDINNLAFHIGLVEAISYWKAACSPEIIVNAGVLNEEQIDWWRDLIIHGLGEFFFRNAIDFTDPQFFSIRQGKNAPAFPALNPGSLSGDLVMIGGGKDSIVTIETLKKFNIRRNIFMLNPTPAASDVTKRAGFSHPIIVKRTIDPKLIELNKQGYLNGHTPFSAYLAFLGSLVGILHGFKYVIASNELSAGEGNTEYRGMTVNHQYSKSFRFEKRFREYFSGYIGGDVEYFSFLRPLYELQISERFAAYVNNYPRFVSCNVNRGISWCGSCPKCAFVYLSLFPYLSDEQMRRIFPSDFFESPAIQQHIRDLVGLGSYKPFDCVGTTEESILAVHLVIKKLTSQGNPISPFFEELQRKLTFRGTSLSNNWNDQNFVPESYKLLLMRRLLILGFAREGKSTNNYLRRNHPDIAVTTADKKDGPAYLERLSTYDAIVRSPGIPATIPQLVRARNDGVWVTSATNIFLAVNPGTVIGITGTKGKSTTSSLIFEILKKKFSDVRLVGNIGQPALDYLEGATHNTLFVMELSSHQLEDCRVSPHIAVILNIVPEHLDYYKNFDQYVEAKRQIVAHQTKNDFVVYNPAFPIVKKLAQGTASQKIPIVASSDYPSALKGAANRENIMAAVSVAKILGVDDKSMAAAIRDFKPLEHRLEFVGEFDGITFYNDSLATIPEATIHALEALGPQVATLITGGYDRGLSYDNLGKAISQSHVKTLILFPDTGDKIADAVKNKDIAILRTSSMQEAVSRAFTLTPKGKVCILSPASASFNLFTDYRERGEAFKTAIRSYESHRKS